MLYNIHASRTTVAVSAVRNGLTLDLSLVLPLQEHTGQHSSSTVSGHLRPFMFRDSFDIHSVYMSQCFQAGSTSPRFIFRNEMWELVMCYQSMKQLINRSIDQLMNK